MSKQPPIPAEQTSFGGAGKPKSVHADRRDLKTELQSSDQGDADTNLEQQGRQGNTAQNTTQQRRLP